MKKSLILALISSFAVACGAAEAPASSESPEMVGEPTENQPSEHGTVVTCDSDENDNDVGYSLGLVQAGSGFVAYVVANDGKKHTLVQEYPVVKSVVSTGGEGDDPLETHDVYTDAKSGLKFTVEWIDERTGMASAAIEGGPKGFESQLFPSCYAPSTIAFTR